MRFLKLNKVAGAVSVGVMSGLSLTSISVREFALHSQTVALNIYTNGNADWAMDATIFLKSLYGLMFVAFTLGLALGLLIMKRD